nr:helix-hairpin-helix domain-containing protein [Candidatus Krumholzibacteria bacterium]
MGVALILCLVLGGRLLRHHLLVGPDGSWRPHLWLDEVVASPALAGPEPAPEKPRLTLPLPINTCSLDSLTLLPGVGPVLALRIHEVRLEGVVFQTPADLKQVKGIGPALSAKLGSLIDFQAARPLSAAPDSLLSP